MADIKEGTEQSGEATPKGVAEAAVVERLSRIERSVSEGPTLAKLLQNPGVRAVLEAERTGKKVKVVNEEDEVEAERSRVANRDPFNGKKDEDIEKMSTKELASFLLEQTKASVTSASSAELKKMLEPLMNRLNGLEEYATNKEAGSVKEKIAAVAKKNIDFEEHRAAMVEIQKSNPNLGIEQLLLLARVNAGKDPKGPKASGLQSERPTGGLGKAKREQKEYLGQNGFNALLAEALKNKDILGSVDSDE